MHFHCNHVLTTVYSIAECPGSISSSLSYS